MDQGFKPNRDYIRGSVLIPFLLRFVRWFSRWMDHLWEKMVVGSGAREISRRMGFFKALCVLFGSAMVANGLTLFLAHREITEWGAALRCIGFLMASLGLFNQSDWQSIRDTSLVCRLLRRKGT